MQQPAPDPYRTLGVSRGATDAQIKAAHRALAKRYHPDAATGDTIRFLRVQEAYQVLADPLRRREWDARHAPGPMRAGSAGPQRPRAANGRWTRAEDASGPTASGGGRGPAGGSGPAGASGQAGGRGAARRSRPAPDARAPGPAGEAAAPGRERPARGYTWSASEVPWWEDRGPRESSRRQPGRQRPREAPPETTPNPTADTAPGRQQREAGHDFDVYNRSSGAAWSSAARAYFRRAEADLPRRGSFQHQGTQPLTAARARAAAEEEARRRQWDETRRTAQPRPVRPATGRQGDTPRASRPDGTAPSGSRKGGERTPPPAAAATAAGSGRPMPSPQPGYAWAGVARGAGAIASARASWRDATRQARWPTLSERLTYALVAWIPAAVLIGYAGSAVTGCDRAAVSCPPGTSTVQTVLIALALGLLVALPRVAYTAAIATVAVALAAIAAVVGSWLVGFGPPLPAPALVLVGVFLVVVYFATASWVLADGPRRRPWLPPARPHREPRR